VKIISGQAKCLNFMKGGVIFLVTINLSINSYTQTLTDRQIEIIPQYSFNGTGDIWGPCFTVRYTSYFKKRISWGTWIGCTIHDKTWPISFIDSTGRTYDISIRNVMAGIQGGGNLAYAIVRNKKHEFKFELGGVVRYQSTSEPEITSVLYPILTGLPFPVYVFQHTTRQRTLAVGANVQLAYYFTFNNKISLGITAGWQLDTNGESILPLGISVGRRF
jgi:hypothetical protein